MAQWLYACMLRALMVLAAAVALDALRFAKFSKEAFPEVRAPANSSFLHALSHADMQQLYRDNLEHNLQPHHRHLQSGHRLLGANEVAPYYTLSDLYQLILDLRSRPNALLTSLLVVRDNVLTVLPMSAQSGGWTVQPKWAASRAAAIIKPFQETVQRGVQYQDGLFVLNLWDKPRCHATMADETCIAPVLSFYSSDDHTDMMIPVFQFRSEDMVTFPWNLKINKALLRTAIKKEMDVDATPLRLYQLSKEPPGQDLLDVGFFANQQSGAIIVPLEPAIHLPDHARWKFQIATDALGAGSRLGKLLGMNSVVLKEESPLMEYYYRSLKEGQHYFTFNCDNIIKVLQQVSGMSDKELQAVTQRAREFQQYYLTHASKAVYLAKVMEAYVKLFAPGTMEALVQSLDPRKVKDSTYVLAQLKAAAAAQGWQPAAARRAQLKGSMQR